MILGAVVMATPAEVTGDCFMNDLEFTKLLQKSITSMRENEIKSRGRQESIIIMIDNINHMIDEHSNECDNEMTMNLEILKGAYYVMLTEEVRNDK